MGVRFYVSTANAPFFVDNVMGYGDSIPVTGDYKVGDFIISSTQADGIFGWVCTKAGTPGTWEIIGSGKSGGGEDTPITLTGFSNVVEFDDVRNTISIGIPEYNVETDFLEVHYNGLLLAEGVHYRVDSSNKSIVKLEGNWNPGNYPDQQMIFKVIRGEQGNGKLVQIRRTVDLNIPTTEVITGIPEYVPGSDIMEVHLNGVLLMESIDYRYASGKIIKLDANNPWNPHSVQGQKMYIRVIKNKGNIVPGGGEILDNSIGIEKLTPELVEMINNHKDPRVGELNNLQTTAKTDVVAAINEIKGKADEAFQSGNNAKQGLVDALIAKGAEASTSETWKILNDKVKNLKTNGKKWASGVVDYNYDYASPAGGTVRNLAFKPSLICLCEKGGDKPNYFVGVIASIPGFKTGFNWALNHDGYSDITTEFDDVNYQILDDGFHFYLRSNIHTYQGSVNWMAFE